MNELQHHGIKGQRWGVRRTPEQLGYRSSKKQTSYNDFNPNLKRKKKPGYIHDFNPNFELGKIQSKKLPGTRSMSRSTKKQKLEADLRKKRDTLYNQHKEIMKKHDHGGKTAKKKGDYDTAAKQEKELYKDLTRSKREYSRIRYVDLLLDKNTKGALKKGNKYVDELLKNSMDTRKRGNI